MAGNFTIDLTRFRVRTEERMQKVVAKIAFDLFDLIVTRAPVDTGRFRANNQISFNDLPNDSLLEVDKSGRATLSRGRQKMGEYKLGDTIFIYNNVSYSLDLEYGSSKQAPAGVYRISIMDIVNHLHGAGVAR